MINDKKENDSFELDKVKARQIVQEILNFGVSQTTLLFIIKLLSLELEDIVLMSNISGFISTSERFKNESSVSLDKVEKKIKIYT